ncbi:MAG: acyl-CoA thioesterase [Bacteroidales bacterium]|nr:acyl-CoA thioesterase [Bacteroidales bacterium]
MTKNYSYEIEIKVRDYECDAQGIVNNANYQHYFEHARHEFLEHVGCSFGAMREAGIEPVVARIEINYKNSLRGGELFVCKLFMRREGIRFVFYQDIFRKSDGVLCAEAKVTTVCTREGKIIKGDELVEMLGNYISE